MSVYPRLVTGIAVITGSRPAAEDAVQEALARAWERSEHGGRIDHLQAWVTTVAINLARSWLRRVVAERRARDRLRAGATESSAEELSADRIDVLRAVRELPRRQREAIVLRYYLGMNVHETAIALGIADGTAKATLYRAREVLAGRLGEKALEEANERDH